MIVPWGKSPIEHRLASGVSFKRILKRSCLIKNLEQKWGPCEKVDETSSFEPHQEGIIKGKVSQRMGESIFWGEIHERRVQNDQGRREGFNSIQLGPSRKAYTQGKIGQSGLKNLPQGFWVGSRRFSHCRKFHTHPNK